MNANPLTNDMLHNEDNDPPKMSSGLNLITILTFIGCALGAIFSVWGFFSAEKNFKNIDKMIEQLNSDAMPGWLKSLTGDPAHIVQMITKSYENRIPIVLLSLVAMALCLVGALQMRKLKKQGYLIYIIGELLPFLTQFIFIGTFSFSGLGFYAGICIAALFILLYSLQRKNLVY